MSVTSTASTSIAATGGIEVIPAEQSAERPAAGFELLLAGAQHPEADTAAATDESAATGAEHGTNPTDTKTGDNKDSSAAPPAPKPAAGADNTGLVGALASTPPPVAPADPTPPAAGGSDPAAGVTTAPAPAPTVLDLVAAAISAGSGTAEPPPTDPQTPPAVETDLSALLEPAPRDAGAPTAALAHTPGAPPPAPPTPSANIAFNNAPAPASAPARPPVVDSAGPPSSDRPRPQPQASSSPSSAATFAPTVSTASAASAPSTDEWAAATATLAPPPPAEQLVSVLAPLRTTPNGSYTLRLELKPPEMGRVEMRVEMRDGVLHASIHAEREGAAQLVRDSLSELRDRLNAEGVRTGDLTVSDGGVGPGSRDGDDAPTAGSQSSGPATATSEDPATFAGGPTTSSPDSTSLLDVRV